VNTFIANKFVWNILSSHFYESHLVKITIDILLLLTTVKPLKYENSEQFGLYLIVCVLASSFGTSAYYFTRFFATRLEDMLLQPTYGFCGIYMSLIMYLRQQNRLDAAIIFDSFPLITYNNLPPLIILGQCVLWLVGLKVYAMDISFSIISMLISWTYLRFFYRFNETNVLGDSSEDFAFVAMFPEALKPVTIPMTTAFYNLFALVGLFPELEQVEKKPMHHLRYLNAGANEQSNDQLATQDAIQERRRAKAMKLLDAKMAELSKESESWEDEHPGRPTELSAIKV